MKDSIVARTTFKICGIDELKEKCEELSRKIEEVKTLADEITSSTVQLTRSTEFQSQRHNEQKCM